MNRLYVVESSPTPTGSSADHRLALRPSAMPGLLLAVAAELQAPRRRRPGAARRARPLRRRGRPRPRGAPGPVAGRAGRDAAGRGARAGAARSTRRSATSADGGLHRAGRGPRHRLPRLAHPLVADIESGQVDTLVILGANPVYDAPADSTFARALGKARLRVHHGLYADETAALCHWHVPAAHYLESWGDARAFDGTATVHPAADRAALRRQDRAPRSSPPSPAAPTSPPTTWCASTGSPRARRLRGGLGARPCTTASSPAPRPRPRRSRSRREPRLPPPPRSPPAARHRSTGDPGAGLELALRGDPNLFDGRFANNGWLQELPRPITKLTWDNAVLISPAHRRAARVASQDVLAVTPAGRPLARPAPAWILPGQADAVLTMHLGYGRRRAGHVGNGVGFDAYALRRPPPRAGARGRRGRAAPARRRRWPPPRGTTTSSTPRSKAARRRSAIWCARRRSPSSTPTRASPRRRRAWSTPTPRSTRDSATTATPGA